MRYYIYLLCLVMDAAVSSALCCIYQSFAWFPMVTGQAERMTGSLVEISPPLSIAYLPPLHWTVIHICCRENRPHLCNWGGHVLRYTVFYSHTTVRALQLWVLVCPVDLATYLQDVSLLYWTMSNWVTRWCFHPAAAVHHVISLI